MNKETFTTRVEERPFNYKVTDVFSAWDCTLDCVQELIKLIQTTGTTEQIAEMVKIFAKYDIDLEDVHVND